MQYLVAPEAVFFVPWQDASGQKVEVGVDVNPELIAIWGAEANRKGK